jgi:hypothetical protein
MGDTQRRAEIQLVAVLAFGIGVLFGLPAAE